MVYVIDTSSLIFAWHEVYHPDNAPGFWHNLYTSAENGGLIIPDTVLIELEGSDGRDELYRWCKSREEVLCAPATNSIQRRMTDLSIQYPNFGTAGVYGKNFADSFVIATAMETGGVVVTQETPSGDMNGPKIPDVCKDREHTVSASKPDG